MKTKSKLVLGLSILSAATLAAGATSTFAWYQVESAGATKQGISNQGLVAKGDTHTVGALTIKAAFGGADHYEAFEQTTAANEAAVTSYNTKYGTSIEWNQQTPPTLPAQGEQFAHVALTDSKGDTYIKVGNSKVKDNDANPKWYGTATVTISLLGSNSQDVSSDTDLLSGYAGTYTINVAANNLGYARVRSDVPGTRGDDDAGLASEVSFTVTISPVGVVTSSGADVENGLTKTFYYFVSPKNDNGTTADTTLNHGSDQIGATIEGPAE